MIPLVKREVLGHRMAYREAGEGDPIVFLHGNPTSSYLWRNVIPHLQSQGRCLAPDLIGMGESDKLPSGARYDFVQHRGFLDAFLEAAEVGERVVLVMHDWGSGLGFDWANRHRELVKGLAYMEALVRPITWQEWPETSRSLFQAMRSDAGETICLEKNVFVERLLPRSILRELSAKELDAYLRPYVEPGESRLPTLAWPRQLPIEGEPAEVVRIVEEYAGWLATSPVPKLYVRADPGFLTPVSDQTCRNWPYQEEVTVPGIHFIQEDAPDEIGTALASWYQSL